jgi:cell wall assembly regulator SMI1
MAKKRQSSPAGESSGVAALLARLDAWLKRSRRRYYKGLLPGATQAELDELAEVLGKPMPAELADWLRWHNGQDEDLIGAFVESFNLMSTKAIATTLDERRKEKGWGSSWVPILDDYQDDLVVLDIGRKGLPVLERWEGRDETPEVAPSLEAWLETLVSDIEAGRYSEDPERGEFVRRRDG